MSFCPLVCLLLACVGFGAPLRPTGCEQPEATLRQLVAERDWNRILLLTEGCRQAPGYVDFYRGLALARAGRATEAKEWFQAAVRKEPRRGHYRVELAGALFLDKKWTDARKALLPAFSLPCECDLDYLNDFLATLYYLEGNTPAALKYWNRLGKPVLHDVKITPDDLLPAGILHSAVAFSPGETLTLGAVRKTTAILEESRLIGRQFLRLVPRPDKDYDAEVILLPKSGTISRRPLRSAVLLGRELPFETVHLSLTNPGGSGLNWQSVVRWDHRDSRLLSRLTGPLSGQLSRQFVLEIEARREAWNLPPAAGSDPASATDRRLAVGAGLSSRPDQYWKWDTGAEISWRDSRDSILVAPHGSLFRDGRVLEYRLAAERSLLDLPEHGLTALASAQVRTGRFWSTDSHLFGQLQATVQTRWALDPGREKTAVEMSFHAGTTQGTVPFDKLYHLGLHRDQALAFRGHRAKIDGVRGAGPWGRRFWMGRADFARQLYERPFFSIAAGPFVDFGRVASGPLQPARDRSTLVDLGIQTRLRLAYSLNVHVSLGIDARRGNLVPFVRTAQ